jgi:N-acetylglucosaminyldiphosphoundecaprenol N-acetyl-beta-D-mannosaminyltransferase
LRLIEQEAPHSTHASCAHDPISRRRVRVNGIGFDPVRREGIVPAVETFLDCGRTHVVHFFAGHPTVLARSDAVYRAVTERGDLNVADGVSVSLAARLLGGPTDRVPGSDGLDLICRWGLARGLRHYFYGGTPEVVERLPAALAERHPGICIAGAESPPFRPLDDADLETAARRMRDAHADVVWIGLGAPKQDIVADRLRRFDPAPVVLCIGAAFDFAAGAKRRAPGWMRRLGLEWLYRLLQEPTRLWRRYLIGNARFVAGVAADLTWRRRR